MVVELEGIRAGTRALSTAARGGGQSAYPRAGYQGENKGKGKDKPICFEWRDTGKC